MGRDRIIGPGLGVMLLASVVLGCVYWTARITKHTDNYFYTFSQAMDSAIEKAYGRAYKADDIDLSNLHNKR